KRMSDAGCERAEDYLVRVEADPHEYVELVNTLLINVTEFFRDSEAWEYLRAECLEPFMRRRGIGEPVRAWSVGCASGAEPYSLAITLAELLGERALRDVKIYATDMDERALAQARAGIYTAEELRNLPSDVPARYFDALPGGRFAVRREVRSSIIFGRHNLLADAPISRLDILVCRNVLIYFDTETQQQVLTRFHYALRDEGYLFLGKAETLMSGSPLFRCLEPRHRIFQRVPHQGRHDHLLTERPQRHASRDRSAPARTPGETDDAPAPKAAPAAPDAVVPAPHAVSPDTAVVEIPIRDLEPDPFQPRKEFRERAVRELADSIEQHGILQPLLVRPMQGPNSRGRYWIVAGERRYRASKLLALETLPCRIRPYENMAAAVVALAENVHREDLSEIEKAEALLRIKTLTDKTWDDVSELVKLSRDYVKRLAGLLKLEDVVKQRVRAGEISARVAIALKPLSPRLQVEMAERVVKEGLTAEDVRNEARKLVQGSPRRSAPAAPNLPAIIADPGEEELPPVAREGAVVKTLRKCTQAVLEIDEWLEGRDWSPSGVSDAQRAAIQELYQRVSLLQQQLIYVRGPLKEGEKPEADTPLESSPFPF
ncbi:MAG TPA: CheR family methyltransferase, partial [Armatimonadota bacterium]|nr:CheR family methyltransferase [Armatimonadota bacterium]